MLEQLSHISNSFLALLPELSFTSGILLIVLVIAFGKRTKVYQNAYWLISLFAILIAFILPSAANDQSIFNGLLQVNPSSILALKFSLIAALIILIHIKVMKYDFVGEVYVLFLSILLGVALMVKASHFMSLFLSIEFISICSYLLVALGQTKMALEASMKYLIFGATATAFMLFGISLLYGATGSFDFTSTHFAEHLAVQQPVLIQAALALTLAGPLFKLSAAPFHIWAPDVYEATSTPVLSFLAIVPKIAAIFYILHLFMAIGAVMTPVLGLVILGSIAIGNFSALSQSDSKRMMGYSGIAQAGFMLIGLVALDANGSEATLYYLGTYIFISTAAFLFLDIAAKASGSFHFNSFNGISQRFVLFGIAGLVLMVALTGLPPTSGFTAKFLVFSSLWKSYDISGNTLKIWILGFGLINTAISIYYYFRAPYHMFMKSPERIKEETTLGTLPLAFLVLLTALVLSLFFAPQWILNHVQGLF